MKYFIIFSLLCSLVSGFVDPFDMGSYDTFEKKNIYESEDTTKLIIKLQECQKKLSEGTICSKTELNVLKEKQNSKINEKFENYFAPFFQIFSKLNLKLCKNYMGGYHSFENFSISTEHCSKLKLFLDKKDEYYLFELIEIFDLILSNHKQHFELESFSWINIFKKNFLDNIHKIFMVLGSLWCLVSLLTLVRKLQLPFIHVIFLSILLLFFISIPWTWWQLYKKEFSKKKSEILKGMPSHCTSRKFSFFEKFSSFFYLSSDNCDKYHEAVEVDAFWEISPLTAISVTIAKFFLEPIEYLGFSIKKFFIASISDFPFYIQILIPVFLIFLIIFILLIVAKYRLRTLLFNIEPSPASPEGQVDFFKSKNTLLEEENKKLKVRVEKLEKDYLTLENNSGKMNMLEDGILNQKLERILDEGGAGDAQISSLEKRKNSSNSSSFEVLNKIE